MVEDHITHNVVRVPAAGGSGRGAYFRQVSVVISRMGSNVPRICKTAEDVLLQGSLGSAFTTHTQMRRMGWLATGSETGPQPHIRVANKHPTAKGYECDVHTIRRCVFLAFLSVARDEAITSLRLPPSLFPCCC